MLSNTSVLLILLLGGTAAGFMLGLWFQSLRHKTARRVQQELWDRKFHLAEADRQEAIEAINANNVEMKKVRGTFDSYKVEIQRLEAEVETDRNRSGIVEKDLIQRKQMVAALQAEVESMKVSMEKATTESARKTTVFRELTEEHESVAGELVASRQQADKLGERATDAEGQVTAHEQNIEQLERRFAALSEDKEVVEEELRGRIEELDPLPEQIEAALGEIARWRTQHEELELEKERLLESRESAALEALGEKAEVISALEQRIQELEPLQGQLSDTDAQLQAAREQNDELEKVSGERHTALGETTALLEHARESISHLENTHGETAADLDGRLVELKEIGDAMREAEAQIENLEGRHTEAETKIENRDGEVGHLSARVEQLEAALAEGTELLALAEAAHAEETGTVEQLRGDLEQQAEVVREAQQQIERLTESNAEGESTLENKDGQLVSAEARVSSLESDLNERDQRISAAEAAHEKETKLVEEMRLELEQRDEAVRKEARSNEALTEQLEFQDSQAGQLSSKIEALQTEAQEAEDVQRAMAEATTEQVGGLKLEVKEKQVIAKQLAQRDKKLEQWELRYEKATARAAEDLGRQKQRASELEAQVRSLKELKKDVAKGLKERDKAVRETGQRDDKIAALEQRLELQAGDLKSSRAEVQAMESQHKQSDVKMGKLEKTVADMTDSIAQRDTEIADARGREKELKLAAKAATATGVIIPAKPPVKKKPAAKATASKKKPAAKATPAKKKAKVSAKAKKDDLKLITGIGPKLEKALNKSGIKNFEQLAIMDKQEIAEMAEILGTSAERIKKDNWLQMAKKEHYKKYKERV